MPTFVRNNGKVNPFMKMVQLRMLIDCDGFNYRGYGQEDQKALQSVFSRQQDLNNWSDTEPNGLF